MISEELLYKDEVYAIIGAAIEVHKELGNGFLESVYEEALKIELAARNIPFQTQVRLPVYYKGQLLGKEFVADCIAYNLIILELKCVSRLSGTEQAQIINYLKATGLQLGLLINFGSTGILDWKRFVNTQTSKSIKLR
jgi:GxxExxY protein